MNCCVFLFVPNNRNTIELCNTLYAFASIQYMDFGFENACIYEIIAIGFKLYAILLHFINSLRSNAWLHSPQFKGKIRKNEE